MDTPSLVYNYLHRHRILEEDIEQFRNNNELRASLCNYFLETQNRPFALDLLNILIDKRKRFPASISMEDLMLGCYILGLHQNIEDCLHIWKAKNVDFDSYCGVDIQLMAFGGVAPLINYLQTISTVEGQKALNQVMASSNGGDFDNLDDYFSRSQLPWWV